MNESKKLSTFRIVIIGMFTAIIATLAQISFPLPSGVPITLQTFAVALTGYVLGWKYGFFSMLTYIIIGIIGVPVFAQFSGGPAVLFGKTGGFLYGFILMSLLCGFAKSRKSILVSFLLSLIGLLLCHFCGMLQFSFLTGMTLKASAGLVSFPFLIKDIISFVIAYFASLAIVKALKHSNLAIA